MADAAAEQVRMMQLQMITSQLMTQPQIEESTRTAIVNTEDGAFKGIVIGEESARKSLIEQMEKAAENREKEAARHRANVDKEVERLSKEYVRDEEKLRNEFVKAEDKEFEAHTAAIFKDIEETLVAYRRDIAQQLNDKPGTLYSELCKRPEIQCQQNHAVETNGAAKAPWACLTCLREYPAGSPGLVCNTCTPGADPALCFHCAFLTHCPRQHFLTTATHAPAFQCNGCYRSFTDAPSAGCRACDFDICMDCRWATVNGFPKRKIFAHEPPTHFMAPLPMVQVPYITQVGCNQPIKDGPMKSFTIPIELVEKKDGSWACTTCRKRFTNTTAFGCPERTCKILLCDTCAKPMPGCEKGHVMRLCEAKRFRCNLCEINFSDYCTDNKMDMNKEDGIHFGCTRCSGWLACRACYLKLMMKGHRRPPLFVSLDSGVEPQFMNQQFGADPFACAVCVSASVPKMPPRRQPCEGWMDKYSVGRTGYAANWKRRYFDLNADGLAYMETPGGAHKGKGRIAVYKRTSGIVTCPTPQTHPQSTDPTKEIVVAFHEGGKRQKLLLKCETVEDHDRWVAALKTHCQGDEVNQSVDAPAFQPPQTH